MSKKSVESYLKNALKIEAPEEVWGKIENEPILVKARNETKKKNVIRYSAVASMAACMVIAVTVVLYQNSILNPPAITGDTTMNNTESFKTSSENMQNNTTDNNNQTTAPIVVPPKTEEENNKTTVKPPVSNPQENNNHQSNNEEQNMGINVPFYKVWQHKLYAIANDNEQYIKEENIDKQFHQTVNEVNFTVYSIKGIDISKSIAIEINNVYHRYNVIYNGEFEINGKKYGIVDTQAYYYPEPQKGKYLGVVDGNKIYEALEIKDIVLVDLQKVTNIGEEENLYVAEALN